MSNEHADSELLGFVTPQNATERAAAAWDRDPEQAWELIRRYLISGSIKSKMKIDVSTTDHYDWEMKDIDPREWSDKRNDYSYKSGDHYSAIWYDISWPAYLDEKDFDWLLRRLGTASLNNIDNADKAALLRIYEQIDTPTSQVPIGPLVAALPDERDRLHFVQTFAQAIRAELFDGKGLQYLCQGKWSPFDSSNITAAMEVAGDLATFEKRYVMMAALPLETMLGWAKNFDVPLPQRFRVEGDRLPSSPLGVEVAEQNEVGGSPRKGRRVNVDADKFWDEANRLVDEGVQADPTIASHTIERMTEAMVKWAKRYMQRPYARSTIHKYLEKRWAELQNRSRRADK